MRHVAYRTLFPSLLLCLIGGVAGCHKNEDAATAANAAKTGTPPALIPRSHQLIETGEVRITPQQAVDATPAAEPQGAESLWVSANADPDSGGVPLTVNFTADIQGGPPELHYRWDFGDNSPPAYQSTAQHTYRSTGDFTAVLTVTGPDAEESDEVYIEVSEEGFDVSLDADPDIGKPPLTVHFSAVLDDELPGPFYYQWDFGDGGHDVTNPTTHTYRLAGGYTATCVVTNSQGQTAHEEVDIQVDPLDEEQETQ